MTMRAFSRSSSRRATCRCSRSFSAASGLRGFALRPRFCGARPASWPRSRCARHVVMCDEYSPSRRRSAPTAPGSPDAIAASASRRMRCLYSAESCRRLARSTTSADGAGGVASRTCCAVAGGGALGVPREPTPSRLVEATTGIFVRLASTTRIPEGPGVSLTLAQRGAGAAAPRFFQRHRRELELAVARRVSAVASRRSGSRSAACMCRRERRRSGCQRGAPGGQFRIARANPCCAGVAR